MSTLELDGVGRLYAAAVPVTALREVSLTIDQGDFVAIEGPSGAGKSTLLNVLALLDTPTSGTYHVDGVDVGALRERDLARIRCETFGFIFQSFHLLPRRSAVDNVAIGTLYHDLEPPEARARAHQALEFVGLADRATTPVGSLSGGERQRVAIARAVCAGTPVLLADEPTGNLDSVSSATVMDVLESLNEQGTTVVVVTHDPTVAARARRRVHVVDGRVHEQPPAAAPRTTAPTGPRPPAAPQAQAPRTQAPRTQAAPGAPTPRASRPRPRGDRPPHPLPRARWRAVLRDVTLSLSTDRGRAARLVCVIVLSTMLALTTLGLAQTARYQVSDTFDAQRNRRVALASRYEATGAASPAALATATTEEALERIRAIPGVQDVLGLTTFADVQVATAPTGASTSTRLFGVSGIPGTDLMTLTQTVPGLRDLGENQVLVGSTAASRLGLGPMSTSPTLWVAGRPYEVVGVLTGAGLRSELTDGVIMRTDQALTTSEIQSAGVEIWVQAGAGQQVAKVAALAWTPENADAVVTDAPPDPRGLRDSVESSVSTVLLTLTAVAALAGLAVLSNAMTSAVAARTGELALRRAMGARPRHLRAMVSLECVLLGLVGGLVGAVGSVMALLVVTIHQRWQPVIDLRSLPLGVALGVLSGLVASVWGAHRASRIQPAQALR